jgi:hypothetical protein
MLSKRWQGLTLMALAVTLTLVVALPAQAQRDTGIMNVRALDPDGAPLPGVMVVARGPVGTQTQYTGIDGSARFPGLYPGDYTATFALDGFKTVVREGLTIQAQRTTAFDLTMELATVEETITVTGESPVVDVKSANVAGLYSDDLIDKTPTASGIWAGVLATRDSRPHRVHGGLKQPTTRTTSTVVIPPIRRPRVPRRRTSRSPRSRRCRCRSPARTSRSARRAST